MASKTKKSSAEVEPVQIPAAIRSDAGVDDLLSSLSEEVASKESPKKNDRPTMALPPEVEKLFLEWIPANNLKELVDSYEKEHKNELKDELFDLFVKTIWSLKKRPMNPTLQVSKNKKPDSSGTFIVKDSYKINYPEVPEGSSARGVIVDFLKSQGLSEANAAKLVDDEISFVPITALHPLNELIFGKKQGKDFVPPSDLQKNTAQKLLKILKEQFTAEERSLLIYTKQNTDVKKGFLERVTQYCNSEEELRKVLTNVIIPEDSLRAGEFAASDSFNEKKSRLIEVMESVIGEELEPESDKKKR